MSQVRPNDPIILEDRIPVPVRVVLAAVGMFFLVVPAMDLWRGVWPLNVTTPFFGLLLFGALHGGAVLAGAGFLGPVKRWTVERDSLLIEFTAHRFARTWRKHRWDVVELEVETVATDDGEPTFRVRLDDRDGRHWRSPVIRTRTGADAYRAALAARLGVR
jgi:hypothetical protein